MNQASTIRVRINGEQRPVPEGTSVADLVQLLGLPHDRVAIEHNLGIVRRDRWAEIVLRDADRLEIVQFVGGG